MYRHFLMENGLPWYASNSGFKGDSRIQEEKEGRDQRLQLFLFGEKDKQAPRADGDGTMPSSANLLSLNCRKSET